MENLRIVIFNNFYLQFTERNNKYFKCFVCIMRLHAPQIHLHSVDPFPPPLPSPAASDNQKPLQNWTYCSAFWRGSACLCFLKCRPHADGRLDSSLLWYLASVPTLSLPKSKSWKEICPSSMWAPPETIKVSWYSYVMQNSFRPCEKNSIRACVKTLIPCIFKIFIMLGISNFLFPPGCFVGQTWTEECG